MDDRAPPRPPAAVLFDMDGVLIATEGRWDDVERRLLDRAGAEDVPRSAVRGIATTETYDVLAERTEPTVDRETFLEWYDEAVTTEIYPESDILPGVVDLFDDVRSAGVPVAVVSSARPSWIDAVVERIGTEVDATVSGDAIDRRGKPGPAPYEVAAERVGADPGECVAVEDSAVGVESAVTAGAYTIGYGTDEEDRPAAHERVGSGEALVDRIRTLTRR